MREPAGKCRYCGAEFMSKQSLARHEAEKCLKREPEAPVPNPNRWRKRQMIGGQTVWVTRHE